MNTFEVQLVLFLQNHTNHHFFYYEFSSISHVLCPQIHRWLTQSDAFLNFQRIMLDLIKYSMIYHHNFSPIWINVQSQLRSQGRTQTQSNKTTENEQKNEQNNDAANKQENNEENNDKKDNLDLLSSFDGVTGDVFTHFCNYLAINVILLRLQRINRQFYCMIDKLSFWQKYRHNERATLSMKQIADVYRYRSELYCFSNGNIINLRIKYKANYFSGEYRRCKTEKELEMEKNIASADNVLFNEKARKCYFWLLLNDSPKYQLSKYKEIFCGLKGFKFPYEIKCLVNHLPLKWFYGNINNSNNSGGVHVNIGSIGGGRDLDIDTFTIKILYKL